MHLPGFEFVSVDTTLIGRLPKLDVLYLPAYFLFLELYPFAPSKVAIIPGERQRANYIFVRLSRKSIYNTGSLSLAR